MSNPRGPQAYAHTVDGPTDLPPDELAERKQAAAVDYHQRELAALEDTLKRLTVDKKPGSADKIVEQKRMIADEKAALDAAKGA